MDKLHTDGPWQVTMFRDKYGSTSYKVRMHTHTAIAVCTKSYWPEGYEPETDEDGYYQPDDLMGCMPHRVADARLIAAAPELLEALERLVLELEESVTDPDKYIDRLLIKAKNAIKTATNT